MNSSLVVLSVGHIMTYFMFPEYDQISLRGTKNPFKFAPLLTCGVTALLVEPGAHYIQRSEGQFFLILNIAQKIPIPDCKTIF